MTNYQGELTKLNAEAWGKVLAGFDDACLEQTYGYAAARVGPERLRHLVVCRAESIVAAAQIVLLELPLLRTGVAFVKSGPLWRGRAGAPDPSNLAAAADLLRKRLVDERGLMVRLMPPASPGLTGTTEADSNFKHPNCPSAPVSGLGEVALVPGPNISNYRQVQTGPTQRGFVAKSHTKVIPVLTASTKRAYSANTRAGLRWAVRP